MKLNQNLGQLVKLKPSAIAEELEEVSLEANDNETYIGLVLDSSGSMVSHSEAVIKGFNSQLSTIRRLSEHSVWVWFTLFGTPGGVDYPIRRGQVSDLVDLNHRTYMPYGGTPLLDSIGYTGTSLKVEDKQRKNQAFLLIALSDGQENASRDWDWASVGRFVEAQDDRWVFVFIGPKQEHRRFEQCGYKPENLLEWEDANVPLLMDKTNSALGKFLVARNAGKLLPAFFEEGS